MSESPSEITPALRASDADRQSAIDVLREHYAAGRLTLEEFADRSSVALEARTRRELTAVGADLPELSVDRPVRPQPSRFSRAKRWTIAVFSFQGRRGPWLLSGRTSAVSLFGKCHLDFRGALLPTDAEVIDVSAVSVFGAVELVVPEGVPVELSGFAVFGKHDSTSDRTQPLRGLPTIHIRAFSLFGSVIRFTGREKRDTSADDVED